MGAGRCGANCWRMAQLRNRSKSQIENDSVEGQVLRYIAEKGRVDMSELYESLSLKDSSLSKAELVEAVRELAEQGRIELQELPLVVRSFVDFLACWERNLWLYGSLAISLFTLLIVYVAPSEFPFIILRWIFGSAFVLFIPGYVAVEAVFTERHELDSIERFALSIGLSLAIVPLVGLLLNYSPWGIRLSPVVISLTILTVGLAMIALARRYGASTIKKEN
jgi:hypothetical protein